LFFALTKPFCSNSNTLEEEKQPAHQLQFHAKERLLQSVDHLKLLFYYFTKKKWLGLVNQALV
jgi:hypothetical protein